MRIQILRRRASQARAVPGPGRFFCKRLMFIRLLVVAIGGLLGAAGPAAAHHSVSMFDASQEVVLEGTVSRMEWANPHVWIRVNVVGENGELVEWGVEASNPLDLGRKGWTKNTFRKGDKVTIAIHPARNKRPFGSFIRATLPDGTELGEEEENEESAAATER